MFRFAHIALLSMIVLVNALSVEVSIGGPKKKMPVGVLLLLLLLIAIAANVCTV
jgi:hypothetical protein